MKYHLISKHCFEKIWGWLENEFKKPAKGAHEVEPPWKRRKHYQYSPKANELMSLVQDPLVDEHLILDMMHHISREDLVTVRDNFRGAGFLYYAAGALSNSTVGGSLTPLTLETFWSPTSPNSCFPNTTTHGSSWPCCEIHIFWSWAPALGKVGIIPPVTHSPKWRIPEHWEHWASQCHWPFGALVLPRERCRQAETVHRCCFHSHCCRYPPMQLEDLSFSCSHES